MTRYGGWVVGAVLLIRAVPALGAPPGLPAVRSPEVLAGALRNVLLGSLPTPLYEDRKHWGMQKVVQTGVKWRGKGLRVRAEPVYQLKNDGRWWAVAVTATRPAETLVLNVRDVQEHEAGRMSFTAALSFDANVNYERQVWWEGRRTWSSSTRARLRLHLTLRCETTFRLESGLLLPDAVFRLRVLQANVGYTNLVVEHIAGLGGTAARLLGEAVRSTMKELRPSLESKLLARASAALVKAGDTKEVRIGLAQLLSKKETPPAAPVPIPPRR